MLVRGLTPRLFRQQTNPILNRFFSNSNNCTINQLIKRLVDKNDFTDTQHRLAQEFKQQPKKREDWLFKANWDWDRNDQLHDLYDGDSKPVKYLSLSQDRLKSFKPQIIDPTNYSPDKLLSIAPFPTLQLILAIARKNPHLIVQYPALKVQS